MSSTQAVQPRGIETRSIDWVPEDERHGRIWHQAPLWFLGNFQYFSIPIGFIGPALGLSLVLDDRRRHARHPHRHGLHGLPRGAGPDARPAADDPVARAVRLSRRRRPLFATLFTYLAFNVADQVLLAGLTAPEGLNGAFGWNQDLVAIVCAVGAGVLAIYGHDWVHRMFRILLLISLPLMSLVTLGVIFGLAGGHPPKDPGSFTFAAFMAQFSAAAAYNITYAPYVSDYSRYLPRDTTNRSIIASVFFGASASAIWLIALGAWLPCGSARPTASSACRPPATTSSTTSAAWPRSSRPPRSPPRWA